jgi:hypothetical protein
MRYRSVRIQNLKCIVKDKTLMVIPRRELIASQENTQTQGNRLGFRCFVITHGYIIEPEDRAIL